LMGTSHVETNTTCLNYDYRRVCKPLLPGLSILSIRKQKKFNLKKLKLDVDMQGSSLTSD
jgi:hypothetical protein